MTQQNHQNQPSELLERLKGTSSSDLAKGVRSVEHLALDASEEDGRKRGVRALNRENLAKIKRAFLWFLFVLSCVTALVLAFGMMFLTAKWVGTFIDDPDKLGSFLKSIGLGGLIILATITVERFFSGKDD